MDARILLIPKRENPPTIKANEARGTRKLVAVMLITVFKGFPHSTVQKEDSNRKEIVKRLIQQFEIHPNRDSLMSI